ncbi:MAG: hypothetical protein E6K95_05120 [Thaumarchaeota archaeon]|nr:MAG: hypothetical protein E6K95_05120 [Nitrososphaerota archaeon]
MSIIGRPRVGVAITFSAILLLAVAFVPAMNIIHAASAPITQVNSGLVASDSLTTGNTAGWAIAGNAPPGGSVSNENSSGLYLAAKSAASGTWAGYFAKSPNTNAMLFHAVLKLPYSTIPDNVFDTGLYVQTSNPNFIDYVACVAVVSPSGYYWSLVQAFGPATGAVTTTNLWTSAPNTLPLTQDCTIITNGNNYLKMYLGGILVYQSGSLMLNMPSPFNSYLEVQTNSASAMRFGNYLYYYADSSENITVTNAPAGGTVKIVGPANDVLASAPVSSAGTAIAVVGQYRLPLTASIQAYDSAGNLAASTPSSVTLWGGDVYAVSTPTPASTGHVTQTRAGLDHFDSLTTGNTSYWSIFGSAPAEGAPFAFNENSTGLHLGVQAKFPTTWAGLFAESPNTTATAYHAVITLPYSTIPDNNFNTGMYIQTADPHFINYVACAATVSQSGYQWAVVQASGVVVGAAATTVLWASPLNSMPLTQDCTIITNGQNYLKVYLGGNVVYQSSGLVLNMPSPFNSYIEVQTNSASAMRWSTYVYYYSIFGENVTVTGAPAGGTVKIVDSSNTVLASGPVASSGMATVPVGKYRLPLTGFINIYDSTGTLVASTSTAVALWGGDVYTVSP